MKPATGARWRASAVLKVYPDGPETKASPKSKQGIVATLGDDRTPLLEAALAYAASGLPVFPIVARGKEPAIKGGFHSATTNPETINRLWRIPDRNIGIPTGSISGFWALDIDPGGEEHIRRLEAAHGQLPPTRTVITPRSGRHLWFAYTGPIPSSAGKIAPNIDVRADLGYIAVPPSIGANGRPYRWAGDPQAPLAIAPDWLITLTRKRPSISQRAVAAIANHRSCDIGAYGMAALDREIEVLACTLPGARNNTLNRCAFRLFQLVAGGELDGGLVRHRLIDACVQNGLIRDDGFGSVIKTIESGRSAGLQYPRSRRGVA
jgi:hypothetical protein